MFLTNLRTTLQTHQPLIDYFTSHYGKDAKHYIGYKRAPSANDYPSICYVPVRSQLGGDFFDHHRVSLVIGVHEDGITNDVFDGVARLDDIVQIIFKLLYEYNDVNGSYIEGEFVVNNDLSMRHPFHEAEIQFNYFTRRGQL